MSEREEFEEWLEKTEPKLPTTHDVEVAWRAWQARSDNASDMVGEVAKLNTIINNQRSEIRALKQANN